MGGVTDEPTPLSAEASEPTAADVAKAVGRGTVKVSKKVARRVKDAANADGADRSGLAALIATHALSSAGDAMVAVALASTTFFAVSADQARGKIALYLLLTLLPFTLLIPVAGPLLDRFPHGRRNVIAITAAGRGLMAWVLAGSLSSIGLYPQALAILVLQRAYTVARAAAVIRVRPPSLGLVAANARMNIASLVGSGVAAAVGFSIAKTVGTSWDLRLAALVFLAAAAAALRLPSHIDDAQAKEPAKRRKFLIADAAHQLRRPLVATITMRGLTGMCTLGLAILLKANGTSVVTAGFILGSGVVGGLIGTGIASRLPNALVAKITNIVVLIPLAAGLAAAVLGTSFFQALAVGSVGLGASLAKYGLDATLQEKVDASQTGSAFAKSETFLQLAWAAGGGLGLLLSLFDSTGVGYAGALRAIFITVSVLAAAGLVFTARWKSLARVADVQ
jgi:hypothetical protein